MVPLQTPYRGSARPPSSGLQVGSLKSLYYWGILESQIYSFQTSPELLFTFHVRREDSLVLDKKYLSAISICVKQVISDPLQPNIKFFLIRYGQKQVQLINQ